jgi:hypothetical protein
MTTYAKRKLKYCSIFLTSQALPKYIYLSPPLIFPTTSTELGQKTTRCESFRVLLHYVEWDRFVTLNGATFWLNFSDIFLISPTSDPSDFLLNRAVRAVTLIPLVLHLGLRIGPIQRNGAAPGMIKKWDINLYLYVLETVIFDNMNDS